MSKEESDKQAWRKAIVLMTDKLKDYPNNLQNIHTPFDLFSDIVNKLVESMGLEGLRSSEIVTYNLESIELLIYDYGVSRDKITFITDCKEKVAICNSSRYLGVNIMQDDFFGMMSEEKKIGKEFDVILGNPPYQASKEKEHDGRGKCGVSLWDKFVEKSIAISKEDGYICLIHPSRWRKPGNKLGIKMREKQIKYLEIHGVDDGMKVFKCFTRFDWYIMKNCNCVEDTIIKDQDCNIIKINISKLPFIPNSKIIEVINLIAKNKEEKVELIWNCFYHTQSKEKDGTMSREKNNDIKHPCVYSISKGNNPTFWFSSIKNNDYFGKPKAIFVTGRSTGMIEDLNGEFGLTQFASGIIDSKKNVSKIVEAMRTKKFFEITDAIATSTSGIDKDVVSYFRKDFWKEFI